MGASGVGPSDDPVRRLAELFRETGKAHHRAFIRTDGEDPEWPMWYAEHLREPVTGLLGRSLTLSELVYVVVLAAKEHPRQAPEVDWPEFYATLLIREYGTGHA